MPVRVMRLPRGVPNTGPEVAGDDLNTVETTVNGQTFAWGPGQIRNFADDGLGVAHGAFDEDADAVNESAEFTANGQSRS